MFYESFVFNLLSSYIGLASAAKTKQYLERRMLALHSAAIKRAVSVNVTETFFLFRFVWQIELTNCTSETNKACSFLVAKVLPCIVIFATV
jgi:hypothetical protein